MHISIGFQRCLCIHSLSQVVDITIQVLLYQQQIIPEPAHLFVQAASQESEKFKAIYEKVKAAIRGLFCSMNCVVIREFIILLGPSTYLPKEIYKISIAACRKHLEAKNRAGCGENCGDLSLKEKRRIFSSIICNSAELAQPNKADKVFFFVNTTSPVLNEAAEFEEDPSFDLPGVEQLRRLKIQEHFIGLETPCQSEASDQNRDADVIWYRIIPYFNRLT